MTVQLSLSEVQVAVADYLRKRGAIVEDAEQVQIVNIRVDGTHMSIAGVSPTVIVPNVKLPDGGPYR